MVSVSMSDSRSSDSAAPKKNTSGSGIEMMRCSMSQRLRHIVSQSISEKITRSSTHSGQTTGKRPSKKPMKTLRKLPESSSHSTQRGRVSVALHLKLLRMKKLSFVRHLRIAIRSISARLSMISSPGCHLRHQWIISSLGMSDLARPKSL